MSFTAGSERTRSVRLFFGVLVLNLLIAFPLFYTTYKQFDDKVTPWDVRFYMGLAKDGPASQEPPFRYRVLTSLAVAAMRPLPEYNIPVDYTEDRAAKRDFFHFVILNGFLTVLTSALLFMWLRRRVSAGYAWMGGILYLFSFYTVICGFIPMADAGAHLGILAGIFAFEARRPLVFAAICLALAFVKEAGLLVLLCWVAVYALQDRRRLAYLLWSVPALAAFYAVHKLFPGPQIYGYYKPGFMLTNVFSVFQPSAYGRSGLFQIILAQLPLLAALAGWSVLRLRGLARSGFLELGLVLFPLLWWMGMTMELGTNNGRFIFMAFPAFILFELNVIREFAERWGVEKKAA